MVSSIFSAVPIYRMIYFSYSNKKYNLIYLITILNYDFNIYILNITCFVFYFNNLSYDIIGTSGPYSVFSICFIHFKESVIEAISALIGATSGCNKILKNKIFLRIFIAIYQFSIWKWQAVKTLN